MELLNAQTTAEGIISQLSPYCCRIEIAGSIRRKCPFVKDIDLVLIPNNQGALAFKLTEMMGAPKLAGNKLIRCQMPAITVDIYVATPETWATMFLIRTGSAKHNIKLCTLAQRQGMKLHADGSGLTKGALRIAGDTEESIFHALGLPFIPPEQRN